jgi:phosphoribosylformylglycinamidine cyclo-ligase
MGHRFEIYTAAENAEAVISIAREFNLGAKVIGHCGESDNKKLTIVSEFGRFEY